MSHSSPDDGDDGEDAVDSAPAGGDGREDAVDSAPADADDGAEVVDAGATDDVESTPREERRSSPDRGPTPRRASADVETGGDDSVDSGRTGENPLKQVVRDVFSSVGTVLVIGLVLFAVSGIWPPLVAVESGSMEPHMHKGDLVFIVDEHRFPPDQAVAGTGIATFQASKAADAGQTSGHWSFGNYGDVIVYEAYGRPGEPIIHRAMFYVEAGDDWVAEANPEHLPSYANTCDEVYTCPAPHDGFITRGDANDNYDQVEGISTVVRPEWVKGRAEVRIPLLGYVRLWFGTLGPSPASLGPDPVGSLLASIGAGAAVLAVRD